jgi:hypothetical protein
MLFALCSKTANCCPELKKCAILDPNQKALQIEKQITKLLKTSQKLCSKWKQTCDAKVIPKLHDYDNKQTHKQTNKLTN